MASLDLGPGISVLTVGPSGSQPEYDDAILLVGELDMKWLQDASLGDARAGVAPEMSRRHAAELLAARSGKLTWRRVGISSSYGIYPRGPSETDDPAPAIGSFESFVCTCVYVCGCCSVRLEVPSVKVIGAIEKHEDGWTGCERSAGWSYSL